ncbi:hypothetical protein TD95_002329 [Thielaviopsis punctulata]|uniref:DDT domain-containing protein n=1 Tax=Thielaviopsis punctulata TaxID=72032 RepID=A0A0F4ZDW0_9PEZI|nr:hypothetical protein TD95_002329 [Thielaviopsis punctulata]
MVRLPVLYKRKPVQIPAPSNDIRDENTQRKFICQITGQSKLTFFEALKSEQAGAKEVQEAFPEALKGPVLRRVQFQTISRIDHLVDNIYDEFKSEFFPGEIVTAQISDGEKVQGPIREKIRVGPKIKDDGSTSEPFSRYVISIDDREGEEAVVDGPAVARDRKVFTKAVLRTFIKNAVSREAWNGAPWTVKSEFAQSYQIDTRVPQHLRYDHKLMERKQIQAAKRSNNSMDASGLPDLNTSSHNNSHSHTLTHNIAHAQPQRHAVNLDHEPARLPDLKPKSHKARPQLEANPFTLHPRHNYESTYVTIPPPSPNYTSISLRNNLPPPIRKVQSPPPPPLPKYPIDDLEISPRIGVSRPKLRFPCSNAPNAVLDASFPYADKLKMESIGSLLETWDTLNVYCEVFKLDSFTFDDYVQALCIASPEVMPQLVEEIHCSVLKILVASHADGGLIDFVLPIVEDEEEEEEEEEEEPEDDDNAADPGPEQKAGRATRSSLAKIEAERVAAEAAAAEKEAAVPTITNRAAELMDGYDWIESLRKREFQDGGWQRIVAGLLHQLSRNERKTAVCEKILSELVPLDAEPTQEQVAENYASMDVNNKASIIQVLCMLSTETKAVRKYMEDCSEIMTQYRKDKIEWQRQRKQAMEELKSLNDQRKILLPENTPAPEIEDTKMTETESPQVEEADEESESEPQSRRGARRAGKKDEALKKKKEEPPAPKQPKQSKQFIKLLKDIQKKEEYIRECEEEIAVIDNDLREADCPRTRVLGKDRFWNRYYWFERNGMPYGGLPESSTASANYANGCIWVQGPDELEREGYIDLPVHLQNEYKAKFNMTVPERRAREENNTSVSSAFEWGFLSAPAELDALIHYLDPRGVNELKLRKELVLYRERIARNMRHRRLYLGLAEDEELDANAPKEDADKESAAADEKTIDDKKDDDATPPKKEDDNDTNALSRSSSPAPIAKRSTRSKWQSTPAESTPVAPASAPSAPPRCLAWENLMAINEVGHLHSKPRPPPAPAASSRRGKNGGSAGNKKRDSTAVTGAEEPPRKTRRR